MIVVEKFWSIWYELKSDRYLEIMSCLIYPWLGIAEPNTQILTYLIRVRAIAGNDDILQKAQKNLYKWIAVL